MKLSLLLALSLLPLSCEDRIELALSGTTVAELAERGVSLSRLRRMLQFLQEESMHICFWGMADYPQALYQMENPPFRLMYTQSLPHTEERLLTLCGTRYPNGKGLQRAYRFALSTCANQTAPVISNSRGIDRTVLSASQDSHVRSFVICDCGLAMNRVSAYRSLPSVSLISPYEPDDAAIPARCLSRNMLSTALGSATMILQAPEKSGCLHCATSALDQGKDVFIHREGTNGGPFDGGIALLAQMGAPPVSSYAELASFLGWKSDVVVKKCRSGGRTLYRFGPAWYSLEYV